MSTSMLRRMRRPAAARTSTATNSAATASPFGWPARARSSPARTANEPARSLAKWSAFEASAALWYCARGPPRRARPPDVDDDHDADHEQRPPRRVHRLRMRRRQARHRAIRDEDARDDEERGLGERREMLRLAVPVLMARIGRTHGDSDREERQERGDEVGAGVDRLGDEPEAVRREPRRELERDERARGEDGDERGPALRAHPAKPRSGQTARSGQMTTSCRPATWQSGAPESGTGAIEFEVGSPPRPRPPTHGA